MGSAHTRGQWEEEKEAALPTQALQGSWRVWFPWPLQRIRDYQF